MSKRKYSEFAGHTGNHNGLSGKAYSQRARIEGLLEHHKKALFRSLKVARGFERQKLGRRQKTATAEHADAETIRLEAEVAALKVDPSRNTRRLRPLIKFYSVSN